MVCVDEGFRGKVVITPNSSGCLQQQGVEVGIGWLLFRASQTVL